MTHNLNLSILSPSKSNFLSKKESAPSWLKGKYYIDLSSPERRRKNYSDLTATLLGTRAATPPLRQSSQTRSNTVEAETSPNDPLRIVGVIVDEVTEPTMDGTSGSALYTVPFRLSRPPSTLWADIFVQTWNSPPRSTLSHEPGIASVSGSKIVLDGTTIEEVKKSHRDTLILCVEKANEEEARILERRWKDEERQRHESENHRKTVEDSASDITFD